MRYDEQPLNEGWNTLDAWGLMDIDDGSMTELAALLTETPATLKQREGTVEVFAPVPVLEQLVEHCKQHNLTFWWDGYDGDVYEGEEE